MADSKNAKVNVIGIAPKMQGEDPRYGNWFLIDESGNFSLDRTITATIWLVGGGCDGVDGIWNGNRIISQGNPDIDTGTGTSYSGGGGDGGCVFTTMNVSIPKGVTLTSVIAQSNDKIGTSLNVSGALFRCDQPGYVLEYGGKGGELPMAEAKQPWADQSKAKLPDKGQNGVLTPYGYVGSSGGGGAVCNGISNATNGGKGGTGAGGGTSHQTPGTSATNYGCGGGGGAICGNIAKGQKGGKGKQGCIIIAYVIEQPTLIVQKHYKRVCNTHRSCNTDYYSNNSRKTCCSSGNGSNRSPYASDYTDTIRINTNKSK